MDRHTYLQAFPDIVQNPEAHGSLSLSPTGNGCVLAPGVSHDRPRTPHVHIGGSQRFKQHQIPRDPKGEKERTWEREREKSAKFWAPEMLPGTGEKKTTRKPLTELYVKGRATGRLAEAL